jgi:hypothetical protein
MIPTTASDEEHLRYANNIVSAYNQATPDQLRRGREWYSTAHQVAEFMAEGNVRQGAGVIAALSPQKAWSLNVSMARRAFDAGRATGHVQDALTKVAKIMAGADPAEVLPMTLKTGNFFRLIVDPEDPDAVVIDRHAHDVAVGERYGIKDRGLHNKNRYATLAHAYREAARVLGQLPSVVQSTAWLVQSESR